MNTWTQCIIVSGLVVLAACGRQEVILEGERFDLRAELPTADATELATDEAEVTAPDTALTLPAAIALSEWTHRNGNAQHASPHLAFSAAPAAAFSVKIGDGNSRKHRITADPVVADGRVFTLDSNALVSAHTTSGAPVWSRDLTPASDKSDDGSGGGLAIDGGVLYVTTAFGELQALDAATGRVAWVQRLDAPATGAPTVVDGLVYVISADSVAWAIDAADGRVKWQVPGTPSISNIVGGSGPAVNDDLAIFAFGSGEVMATFRQGGVRRWTTNVLGERRGRAYAAFSDITGEPVISGRDVYAANQSGRVVKLSVDTGDRIWTATEGAYSPVWPVDNALFLVSEQGELVRLDSATGERVWGTALPYFTKDNPRRRKAVFSHYGPVLAGGRLWVASNDGLIRSFDPVTGQGTGSLEINGGASSNPVVVGGTMYVVSAKGQLHAFR
ncbi:PQQ-binding-like beta-propeller repeat protein [Algirhabdus cladophorae]|uniref:PQQ-like beta-propeller repeat protein n=1 Tax=Algirhabdus cladophorae TaxID=3377108 RepID=UPI003B84AC9C